MEALLVIETLPFALPLDCGAKVVLNVALCPAARVKGKLSPVTLKPDPVAVACEIVRLDPPELVKVSDCVWLLPS